MSAETTRSASGCDTGQRDTGCPVSRLCFSGVRLETPGYRRVFADGRSVPGRTVVVWLRRGEGTSGKFGVTVSKRSIRLAVDRSRARRLMREAYRHCRASLAADLDLVLVARPALVGQSAEVVRADFERACRRAGVWRGDHG